MNLSIGYITFTLCVKFLLYVIFFGSVADPGCLSRIPDPDFYPSRIPDLGIPDPKTVTKERGKKNLLSYFFCSHKFHKIEYYVIFEMVKKKFGPISKELLKFLPKKFPIFSQIYGFGIRYPGSGKNLFWIPDPGVKKEPDPGSRIPDPDPQHCFLEYLNLMECDNRARDNYHFCRIFIPQSKVLTFFEESSYDKQHNNYSML